MSAKFVACLIIDRNQSNSLISSRMSSEIVRYTSSLAALEALDADISMMTIAGEQLAQQFGRLESKTRGSTILMREFESEFLQMLDLPRSDRPEVAFADAVNWVTAFERLNAAAQQSSDNCRAALSQDLASIQALDLPSVFYLDLEAVEQSLSSVREFVQETRVLSPASLTGIQRQVANGLMGHARTHVSRLLEGAREEALALLSAIDSRLTGAQLAHQIAVATKAVNSDVRLSYERLQVQVTQILESTDFDAIVLPEIYEGVPSLQDVDASRISEADIDATSSAMLHLVSTSISKRLSDIQGATELCNLILNAPRVEQFTVATPNSLDEVPEALQSLVALVDVVARAVASLMQETTQGTDALLAGNIFIGKDAYALKRKLREQIEAVRNARERWPQLFAAAPAARTKILLSSISELLPFIGNVRQRAATISNEARRLRAISPAYDIASVIELQDGSPVGLRSLAQSGNGSWLFSAVTAGSTHDSQRTICFTFQIGMVPRQNFRIELAPESILGDWLRWVSGGFLRRPRPVTGPRFPHPSGSLQGFLRIHVLQQWAGRVRLQDFIASVNRVMRQSPEECETYLSNVET